MSVLEELKRTIAKVTHGNEQDITVDTALKDMNIDSLHWIQIIVAIESAFDVEIDIDKMREFVTVGDFVKHVEELGG